LSLTAKLRGAAGYHTHAAHDLLAPHLIRTLTVAAWMKADGGPMKLTRRIRLTSRVKRLVVLTTCLVFLVGLQMHLAGGSNGNGGMYLLVLRRHRGRIMVLGRSLHRHVGLHVGRCHVRRVRHRRHEGRAPVRLRGVRVRHVSGLWLERRGHATSLARAIAKLVVGGVAHLVVVRVEAASAAAALWLEVATVGGAGVVALDRVAGLTSEVSTVLRAHGTGVRRDRALSHVALQMRIRVNIVQGNILIGRARSHLAIATETSKRHWATGLLEARGRSPSTGRGLRDRRRGVCRRGHTRVAAGNGDRSGRSSLWGAVGHGRRVEAELDARLGTADRTAVGSIAARAVGSHGDGALAGVVRGGPVRGVDTASDSRDCGSDG